MIRSPFDLLPMDSTHFFRVIIILGFTLYWHKNFKAMAVQTFGQNSKLASMAREIMHQKPTNHFFSQLKIAMQYSSKTWQEERWQLNPK